LTFISLSNPSLMSLLITTTLIKKAQACGACHGLPLHPSSQALFHAFWTINLTLHNPHLCHGGLGTTSSPCQIFDCKSLSLWPFLKFHSCFTSIKTECLKVFNQIAFMGHNKKTENLDIGIPYSISCSGYQEEAAFPFFVNYNQVWADCTSPHC
jgi:hypothetical protein